MPHFHSGHYGENQVRTKRNAALAAFRMVAEAFHFVISNLLARIKNASFLFQREAGATTGPTGKKERVILSIPGRKIGKRPSIWPRSARRKTAKARLPAFLPEAAQTPAEEHSPLAVALGEARRQAESARENALKIHRTIIDEMLPNINNISDLIYKSIDQGKFTNGAVLDLNIGRIIFKDSGLVYVGTIAGDSAEGHGILKRGQKEIYCGQISRNRRNGFGIDTEGITSKYQGNFLHDTRSGYGKLETMFCVYVGEFDNGSATGFGVVERKDLASGWERYEGECREAEPHGYGVCYYRDGQRYYGEFKHGQPYGYGIRELSIHQFDKTRAAAAGAR